MSNFAVNIRAGATIEDCIATVQGSSQELISANDNANTAKFGLNDDDTRKRLVEKSFGRWPDDLYLTSPTPWNDLYNSYGWQQVTTNLQVLSATVSSFKSSLQAVNTVTLHNSGSVEATFHADVSKTVSNTTSSSWSSENSVSVKQMFKCDISFLGTGGGGETSFSYTHG